MATYTSGVEFAKAQRKALADLKELARPFERAVRTVLALQSARIFERGQKSDGGRIGRYDLTREMWVNPKKMVRATAINTNGVKLQGLLPPTGKTGRATFASGKKKDKQHKTTWVANYADLRNRIGRRIDTVDLILTGDLRSDWSTALLKGRSRQEGAGLVMEVTLKRAKNQKKREGLEDKYGTIFEHTTKEVEDYFRILGDELKRRKK